MILFIEEYHGSPNHGMLTGWMLCRGETKPNSGSIIQNIKVNMAISFSEYNDRMDIDIYPGK